MPWAWEVKMSMEDMDRCNCPPIDDVFRESVGTKDPCPVHPEPDLSEIVPMIFGEPGHTKIHMDCYGFGYPGAQFDRRY